MGAVVAAVLSLGALAPSALADPTPFASATSDCSNQTVTFPVQTADHSDVTYSVTSTGASGSVVDYDGYPYDGASFSAGDKVWGTTPAISAGTAPTLDVNCSGGSVLVQLYDTPTAPVTVTGVSSSSATKSLQAFVTRGSGQYVADVTIDQGAIDLNYVTIASSGEYSLGSLGTGDVYLPVDGLSGPTAHYSLTVRELPVQISGLSFGAAGYAAPGTILTGSFAVSGDTTINADVTNAAGQVVRHLGSFPVSEGSSSVTWDARGDGGASLPDGRYFLDLASTDPNGNVTSAQTSIVIDGTPPSVSMTSPGTIRPSQSISFSVTDAESGVASISLLVDGQDVEDFGGYSGNTVPANGSFSYAGPWSLGGHSWEIQSVDNVGNHADVRGTFNASNPPPPPPPPRLTSSNATSAFGRWLRVRYGPSLRNYWTCPSGQIYNNAAQCLAEIRTGRVLHLMGATAKYRGSTIAITGSFGRSWTRRWSKYSKRIIAGTPGSASANSPAFDWGFLASAAHYDWRHHKRSFVLDAYDGDGAGFGRIFRFTCRVHSRLIQCTNAFGDSLKYRP